MKKSIINISLVFAFIFSMFFIGTGNVSASACSCYYRVQADSAPIYYKLDFDIGKADFDYAKQVTVAKDGDGKETKIPYQQTVQRGNPFRVNSTNITSKNCSKKACKTANLVAQKSAFGDDFAWRTILACDTNCKLVGSPCSPCTAGEKATWSEGRPLVVSTKTEYEKIVLGEDGGDKNGITADTEKSTVTLDDVIKWGEKNGSSTLYSKNKINACTVIDGDLKKMINKILTIISVASIILLIIMSMIEFVKAITGANDDLIKTAFKHTIIRIVCVVILFLLPILVSSAIDLVNKINEPQTDENGNYKIGDDGNPLCGIGK